MGLGEGRVRDAKTVEGTPVNRVGVIGGGQLAWMMAAGAQKLGLALVIQTPKADDPAVAIATDTLLAPVADVRAAARLAAQCDVITFENEFVDLAGLKFLEDQGVRFCPRLDAIAPLLDKYTQRRYLNSIGLPNPPFATLESPEDLPLLADRAATIGFPLVLKTRRLGYDGQGTVIVPTLEDLRTVWQQMDYQPVLLEAFIPFERELAVMVARSSQGEIAIYPTVETQQVNQVCQRVFAPAAVSPAVDQQVRALATTLVTRLDVVGIYGIELFLTPEQQVLVNEIAPRTHNSGHYTLDACVTSQFEQQLRAVSGHPLGDPSLTTAQAVMVNLLGYESTRSDYTAQRHAIAQIPQAHLYWYGKAESRPGRKLGHVTVLADADADLATIATQIERLWYPTP